MKKLSPDAITQPINLGEESDIFFMQDYKFQQPKAIIQLAIYTNNCGFGETLDGLLFAKIWKQVFLEYASETLYLGS